MKTISDYKEEIADQDKLINHYRSLSEVYLSEVENLQEPLFKIMTAKGILIEIESDLLAFLKKSKHTEKSKNQENRIHLLNEILEYFSNMASNNYQMKLLLRKAARDLNDEKKRHRETERALDITTHQLNAE